MPIVVVKDSKTKTKMIMAKVAPSKGVEKYAAVVAKRAVECSGHRRLSMRSDSEPAILALKEAVRRETDGDCTRGSARRGPSGTRVGRESGEDRAGPAPGDQGRAGEQSPEKI